MATKPTQFSMYDMNDLWAFTTELSKTVSSPNIKNAIQHLRDAQRKAMLHERDSFGSSANGISIYMPKREYISEKYIKTEYQNTRFARDTGWDDFLIKLKAS